jgi:hypothetical protein
VPGLPEFRDALDAPRRLRRLMPEDKAPEYGMVAPPITWVRDGDNPPRPVIDPKPWHTDKDVLNAFRIIQATHPDRPKSGRKRRDLLLDAESAILHDRYGWTYERVTDHYGWLDYTRVSKYLKRGREIVSKS